MVDEESLPPQLAPAQDQWTSVHRAKELFRIFEADDFQQQSFSSESAGLNEALAPHLQLLLHTCEADNAFVSVFDRNHLYIIAEAEARVDGRLQPESTCHGRPMIGRLCSYTLEQEPTDPSPIFHVADLAADPRFRHLSFVADPKGLSLRFYAGVPLTPDEEEGISIGTVAIMGRHVRPELSPQVQSRLRGMAKTIMSFLRMKRDAADGIRAKKLTQSLNNFAPNENDLVLRGPSGVRKGQTGAQIPPLNVSKSKSTSKDLKKNVIFQQAVKSIAEAFELGGDGNILFLNAKKRPPSLHSGDNSNDSRIIACSDNLIRLLHGRDKPFLDQIQKVELMDLVDDHPRGKLWQFDADGILPDSRSQSPTDGMANSTANGIHRRLDSPILDLIRLISPKAKQIFMVPMLDSSIGQWHSICFVWCTNTIRLFSQTDLGILATYNQAVMTECCYQEVLATNIQKASFVGSISHELRTPLHGIMAGTELLDADVSMNASQLSMVQMIRSCSQTLLDTISHILEYSKINNVNKVSSDFVEPTGVGASKLSARAKRLNDAMQPLEVNENIDIAEVMEHAIDIVYQSYQYSHDISKNAAIVSSTRQATNTNSGMIGNHPPDRSPQVPIMFDIEPGQWTFAVEAGPFKRLIMNLVGNALKYTSHGRINVCMSKVPSVACHSPSETVVKIQISDTGCGMSREYLEQQLFVPFAQENPLCSGVGLGLSICKSIVEKMGGTIVVDSTVGEGTDMVLLLPLHQKTHCPDIVMSPRLTPEQAIGKTIAISSDIGGREDIDDHEDTAVNLVNCCKQWFSLECLPYGSAESADLVIAKADTILRNPEYHQAQFPGRSEAGLIVLCDNLKQQVHVQQSLRDRHLNNVQIICQPYGPIKLALAIKKCLDAEDRTLSSPLPLRTRGDMPILRGSLDEDRPTVNGLVNRSTNGHISVPSREHVSECTASQTNGFTTTSVTAPAQKPRLLLVDDNKINLRVLETYCRKKCSAPITTALDGSIALNAVTEALPESKYDIIFMDISMPVMNGIQATTAIRVHEKQNSLQPALIVAITGLANQRDKDNAMAAGADAYLTKPLKLKQIGDILDNWSEDTTSTSRHTPKSTSLPLI